MKHADGIFRHSIHNNLSDKRSMDNPKRQEDLKEHWKRTKLLRKNKAGGTQRSCKRDRDGKEEADNFHPITHHLISVCYPRRQCARLKNY